MHFSLQMLAEAVLSPVHLGKADRPYITDAINDVSRPGLMWELHHVSHGIAALREEEGKIRCGGAAVVVLLCGTPTVFARCRACVSFVPGLA